MDSGLSHSLEFSAFALTYAFFVFKSPGFNTGIFFISYLNAK